MKKRTNRSQNSSNLKREPWKGEWIITKVVVPIVCSLLTIFLTLHFMDKPTDYLYKEVPNLDNFKILEYLPINEGNYWVYNYIINRAKAGGGEEQSSGEMKMVVERIYSCEDYSVIELTGDIFTGNNNGKFGLLVISNKIYYVQESDIKLFIDDIEGKDSDLNNVHLSLIYDFPLYDFQRYGDIDYLLRKDLQYFWNVNKNDTYSTRIDNRLQSTASFTIKQTTNPDDFEMTFLPYVGVTYLSYHHNGSIEEFTYVLESYKLKE